MYDLPHVWTYELPHELLNNLGNEELLRLFSLSFYWFNDLWIWIRNSWIGTRNSWIWTCSFEFQLVVLSFQLVLLSIQRVIRNSQLVTRNSCFTISLVFHHTQKRKKSLLKHVNSYYVCICKVVNFDKFIKKSHC